MGLLKRYGKGKLKDRNDSLRKAIIPVYVNLVNHKKRGWGTQHKYFVGHTTYRFFYEKLPVGHGGEFWQDQQVITGMFTEKLFKTRKNLLRLLVDIAGYCRQQGIRNVYIQITPLIAQGFSPEYAHMVLTKVFADSGIKLKVLN